MSMKIFYKLRIPVLLLFLLVGVMLVTQVTIGRLISRQMAETNTAREISKMFATFLHCRLAQ